MREGSIRRVVLVFPGALGDLLLALPALRRLRRRHRGARATLVVAGPLCPLARCTAVADDVCDLDGAESRGLFGGDGPPPWLSERPALYCWLGAHDVAFRERVAAWTAHAEFFRVERGADGPHAMVAYARAVGERASLAALAAEGRMTVPPSTRADTLCRETAPPLLAMHRGAGAPAKRWRADGFAEVAAWWRGRGGAVIDVTGPADTDLPALGGAVRVRDWPLPDLAALLGRIDAYVGNDSGIAHLAGAVGAWGVVLFGATPARRWRPASGLLRVVDPGSAPVADERDARVGVARVLRALHRATEP